VVLSGIVALTLTPRCARAARPVPEGAPASTGGVASAFQPDLRSLQSRFRAVTERYLGAAAA